jgi:hypothetical protein
VKGTEYNVENEYGLLVDEYVGETVVDDEGKVFEKYHVFHYYLYRGDYAETRMQPSRRGDITLKEFKKLIDENKIEKVLHRVHKAAQD